MATQKTQDPEVAATWEPIESLKPWAKNPRKNDGEPVDRVAKSIQRFGFSSPIVVRAQDRRIIAGHTRWKAAKALGMTQVPVRFLPLDEDQAAALALADNRLTEITPWDDEALADVMREIEAAGVDMDGLGWTSEELDALMEGPAPEMPEPSDDVPEVQDGPADSVVGQVYELGPHRLIVGDCRDAETVARLLDGKSINVAFTSPPYASQRKYDEASGFKPIPPDEYVEWFDAVQANVKRHLAADGSWFVNIKEHCEEGQRHLYVKDLTIAHVRRWAWRFVDELIWRRNGMPGLFGDRFKNEFEPVFHFGIGASVKFRGDNAREARDSTSTAFRPDSLEVRQGRTTREVQKVYDSALPGNVLEFAMGSNAGAGHSAAFPVALPEFFIKAYTDPGDVVFDPFLGSGTTLIAAAKNKRIGYGCEISTKYADLIRRRWTTYADEAGVDAGPGALR
jgi:DNA modification methylase